MRCIELAVIMFIMKLSALLVVLGLPFSPKAHKIGGKLLVESIKFSKI